METEIWIACIKGTVFLKGKEGPAIMPSSAPKCGRTGLDGGDRMPEEMPSRNTVRFREGPEIWVFSEMPGMSVRVDARMANKDQRHGKYSSETVSPHLPNCSVHGLGRRRRLISKARDLSESKTRPARYFIQDPG